MAIFVSYFGRASYFVFRPDVQDFDTVKCHASDFSSRQGEQTFVLGVKTKIAIIMCLCLYRSSGIIHHNITVLSTVFSSFGLFRCGVFFVGKCTGMNKQNDRVEERPGVKCPRVALVDSTYHVRSLKSLNIHLLSYLPCLFNVG